MTHTDRSRDYAGGVGVVVAIGTEVISSVIAPDGSEWLIGLFAGVVGLSAGYLTLRLLRERQKKTQP
jgi:hypothetical protein